MSKQTTVRRDHEWTNDENSPEPKTAINPNLLT